MNDAQPLLIFPYNGNALEALDCLGSAFRLIGFVDDTAAKRGQNRYGHPIYGREAFDRFPEAQVLAVPGSPGTYLSRKGLILSLGLDDARFARVIHPNAHISPLAEIGVNVLIMAGVVVTSNAVLGSHTCILPNTVIHHDAVIGDWSLVGSSVTVAGSTVVEENCYIGSGTSLINGIRVHACALVGLGSNVIASVPPGSKVIGNPARQLGRKREAPSAETL